jgi:hypothetical protein
VAFARRADTDGESCVYQQFIFLKSVVLWAACRSSRPLSVV